MNYNDQMNLLQQFKNFIKQENLFQPTDKLLLAVSGGVDSVVLCELCKQAGYDFIIAHCNFQLRGGESERDKEFVKKLAEKYGVAFLVKDFNTTRHSEQNKVSIQEAARELRYQWFKEIVAGWPMAVGGQESVMHHPPPAIYITTAHHANDNIETLLMNFFKGTGIKGLRGILPKQGIADIVHPLLFASKEDLKQFAEENKLPYEEDSSNISDKYTRNYFRNQVIPSIKKVFPQAEENLKDNLQRFRDIEKIYQHAIEQHKKKLLEQKGNEVHIAILKLKKAEPLHTIIYEIIKEFGFTSQQVNEVINLLGSESGKYVKSHSHRIIKNRNWLIISPKDTQLAETILIEEGIWNWKLGIGKLTIESLPNSKKPITNATNVACLDAAEIKFPLLVRPWKQGDYFYPLGMQKKKKLSRFFIDQKLSRSNKEKVWVIEMNKKIVWIIGMRIDDRFKITGKTKQVLVITISNP